MHCPRCFVNDGDQTRTKVLETRPERPVKQYMGIRRRRRCTICGYRFTTIERPRVVTVRNREGKVEAFDEERLFRSLQRATAGTGLEDGELRWIAEDVRWESGGHRGAMKPASIARLVLGRLPRRRSGVRDLYRERTPSLAGEGQDETTIGVVMKRRLGNGPVLRLDEPVLEPFDRRKLLASVQLAVHRPIDADAIADLVDNVASLVRAAAGPVSTAQIREWVIEGLRPLDPYARLRVLAAAPDPDLQALKGALGEIEHGLIRRRVLGLEQFSRAKLAAEIKQATAGRDAVSDQDVETFAAEIGERVRERTEPVESEQIGRWVLAWLRQRDFPAFINFLAVQPLDDPHELAQAFRGELDHMPASESE